ncbi:DEAD/DEAH box helicase family protein [Methylobacterium sp. CM6246]
MDRMSHLWLSMGNKNSLCLRTTWRDVACTLNLSAAQQFNDQWDVLALPTGSGKTQSLALYCSMLKAEQHPGILIVTPLKEQADEICAQINNLASSDIALSYHTASKHSTLQLQQAPVLAITHSGYLTGLKSAAEQSEGRHKLRSLTSWVGGERLLRVIDEGIELHHTYKTSLRDLSILCGALRYVAGVNGRRNLLPIDELCASISAWNDCENSSERYLSQSEFVSLQSIEIDALIGELDSVPDGEIMFGRDERGVSGADIKRQCQRTLREIRGLVRVGSPWITKRGKLTTITSAECLLGLEERAGVILDATARVDTRYELLGDKARIIAPRLGVRSYNNVNLWIIPDQRVGKEYMTDKGWELWAPLTKQMERTLGAKRDVLVCCHKDVREKIEGIPTDFNQTAYAHWGAITGKNHWRDFDTVVVVGLNYLDRSASAETYIGIRGATNGDWLQSAESRKCNKHEDIRQSIMMSHLSISVVQAVNRVRCRRTNDTKGGCDKTDVVLLAPKGTEGKILVDMLQSEMPGLQVRQWPLQLRTRKERAAPSKERIFEFLRGAPNGIHTNKEVSAKLGVSRSTYDRVIANFRNERSAEAQNLRLYGIRYISQTGGHTLSGFMKKATIAG